MNELTRAVATHVRTLRKQRGLSLTELARAAGMSKTTLSGLERGSGNPTVDTVWALAQALDVPVGALIRTEDEPADVRVIRNGEGELLSGSVLDVRLLAQPIAMARIEVLSATIHGTEPRHGVPHAPGTVEHILARSGRLLVGPEDNPVELSDGDYASFPGDLPHVYKSITGRAEAHIIICYPSSNWATPPRAFP